MDRLVKLAQGCSRRQIPSLDRVKLETLLQRAALAAGPKPPLLALEPQWRKVAAEVRRIASFLQEQLPGGGAHARTLESDVVTISSSKTISDLLNLARWCDVAAMGAPKSRPKGQPKDQERFDWVIHHLAMAW